MFLMLLGYSYLPNLYLQKNRFDGICQN